MKNLKKTAALLLCAVLLVVCSVAGTLAYLQSQSKVVNNTFTVGDIEITLDEAKVDEYGVIVSNTERVIANEYRLLPGHEYVKDPTVTVVKNSEACFVRMKVHVANLDNLMAAIPADKHPEFYGTDGVFLLQNLVNGWDSAIWNFAGFDAAANTYEFRYFAGVPRNTDAPTVLPALFTSIEVPGFIDNDNLELMGTVQINVVAEAIQADGFETAAEAWDEWNADQKS